MKKRIISLCIAIAMIVTLVPNIAIRGGATSIHPEDATKRLTGVNEYDKSGTLTASYEFCYDADLLEEVVTHSYGEYAGESSTVLLYDTAGRLISNITSNSEMPEMTSGAEYTYNGEGQMVSSLYWEGGSVEEKYEYDSKGNRIRAIEEFDGGKTITEYTYEEDNLIISATKKTTYEGSTDAECEVIAYSYYPDRQLFKTLRTGGYTDALTVYSYDYHPFVFSQYIDSYGSSNSNIILQDSNGCTLYSFHLFDPVLYVDTHGYLAKIVDTDRFSDEVLTYTFLYDGVAAEVVNEDSVHSNPKVWNQVYIDFILEDRENADSHADWEWVGYELIYLNDDDIPELWITYSSWAEGCRIVSYQDGKLTQELLGSGGLRYEEYSGIFHHSYGHMGLYFDTIFQLDNCNLITVAEGRNEIDFNKDVEEYFWNGTKVSKETYLNNIKSSFPSEELMETSYDAHLNFVEILNYLYSLAPKKEEITYEDFVRKEWIKQHMEYAASDEYRSEIVGGYSNRMMAVFRDALDDEDINSYEARKAISSVLNLELEFSETDMYELILAEILYGKNGQSITEEAYAQNLEKTVANMTKVLVNIATTGDSAKDIPEDTLKSIKELYELLQTLELGSEEYSSTYSKFISLIKGNVADIKSKVKTELIGDAAFTGLGIVIDGAFEQYEALEDILNYLNNYVAYQSTSRQTRDVLGKLLGVIYVYQGLAGVDEFIDELGLWDSMINWSDFQLATFSIMEAMLKYEQEGAAAVAAYAVDREQEAASKFGQKALKSVTVFAVEKAASCIPVINAILIAKNIVSGVVTASIILDQIFTNVDECEYALDILTKSYVISVMLDETVDVCAKSMEDDDFYSTTVFDRSVVIYKQNLLNAFGYAVKYADMVLKNAQQELFEYDQEWHLFDGRERLVQAVDWYTNSLAILKEQQVDIESIACHDSDLYYDPLTDEIIYNFKDSRIYIVACPVSVVVKNEAGEQIAYLSGESDQVAAGHEFYFHTIKATADSGEYIKVAIVPDHYQIELIGADNGTMNAFVADFTTDDVGEVETYFNIPVKKDSAGYFETATDGSDSTALVMDEEVYFNMESSEDIPTEVNDNIQWIWIVGSVAVVVIGLFLLLRKKHRNA